MNLKKLFLSLPLLLIEAKAAVWHVESKAHPTQSGDVLDITKDDTLVAQFVFQGDAPSKPHLNLYGVDGEILTQDEPTAQFPHHRGVFVGWDEVISSLGSHDLWHLDTGRMAVAQVEDTVVKADGVALRIRIEWFAGTAPPGDLLLTEWRTIFISKGSDNITLADTHCRLRAERALTLDGDLQHAGFHFRAHEEVNTRAAETRFLESPADSFAGNDLEWCRMMFGRGARRYAVTLMNAPGNPVEELSQRTYGRFGYFFSQVISQNEALALNYRVRVVEADLPGQSGGRIYEAEDATLGGSPDIKSDQPGFTGSGFVDYSTTPNSGQFIEWSVGSETAGNQAAEIRYALFAGNRPLELKVNGAVVQSSLAFPVTGAWTTYATTPVTLPMQAGTNTIRLTSIGSSGANIDHLAFDVPPVAGVDGGPQASRAANESAYTDYLQWLTDELDSDLDEMPDVWEMNGFGNLDETGEDDTDGGGQSNADEFIAGTDPNNAQSEFRIHVVEQDGSDLVARWQSVPDRNYQLFHNSNLSGAWLPASGVIPGTGGELEFRETMPPDARFYRVHVSIP